MPASSPSDLSSKVTFHPFFSAQRVYILSNISAQSWASVPPAPAFTVSIASALSYSPESINWISNLSNSFSKSFKFELASFIKSSSCISYAISASEIISSQCSTREIFSFISRVFWPNSLASFWSAQTSGDCNFVSSLESSCLEFSKSKTLLVFSYSTF